MLQKHAEKTSVRKEGPVLNSGGKLLLVSTAACILNMMNGEQPGFSWVLYWTAKGAIPLLMPVANTANAAL